MPYVLHKHKVLLLDCVGYAGQGDLASGETIAADTLIMFTASNCRTEPVHGDVLALAWRLRRHLHGVVFVNPMSDEWLRSNR